MEATMTRAQTIKNIERHGLMVEALKIKNPNDVRTLKAIRDHAKLVDTFCASCFYVISAEDEDDVEVVRGKRYHSGCEPR